ncbi:MAG: rod shape-determining protein RodA [Peptoniphilaceae bacterium]|nr:rod shape-determining protein RodA [Peptoniphilaceae bacterium]MDD7383140.1 rod shape-determining protein RodA [Peptoniphilaceae bacterium]MDY3738129.1 rod shape-determining protein RodA [Peptoniphilaceae bacterium]
MFNINKKSLAKFDWILLFITIFLVVFGIIVLYSSFQGKINEIYSQLVASGIGFILILILFALDMNFLKKFTKTMYIISILLLVVTLIIGVGGEERGGNSWIRLGFVSIQPSEISKFLVIFSVANYISENKKSINEFQTLLKIIIFSSLPICLVLLQPDFGTAMVYVFIIAAMLFAAGLSRKWIILIALSIAIILPLAYFFIFDEYMKNRILNFLDPSRDISGSGWQQSQGLIAIGSGGFFGRGFMKGSQAQYGYIPEKETDYIFSVLVEEFGFLGGIITILSFGLLIYRMIMVAKKASDSVLYLITVGIAAMFFIHLFENIGMTMGVMPVTGIPLPLFSSGGTFQTINLISIGVVLSISAQKDTLDFSGSEYEPFSNFRN